MQLSRRHIYREGGHGSCAVGCVRPTAVVLRMPSAAWQTCPVSLPHWMSRVSFTCTSLCCSRSRHCDCRLYLRRMNDVMFLLLSVCPSARLLKKLWTDFYKNFWAVRRGPRNNRLSLYHNCDSTTTRLRYDDTTTQSTTTKVIEITTCVRFDCDTTTTRLRRKIDVHFLFASNGSRCARRVVVGS